MKIMSKKGEGDRFLGILHNIYKHNTPSQCQLKSWNKKRIKSQFIKRKNLLNTMKYKNNSEYNKKNIIHYKLYIIYNV